MVQQMMQKISQKDTWKYVSAKIREIIRSDQSKKRTVMRGHVDGEPAGDEHSQDAGHNKRGPLKRARMPSTSKNLPRNKRKKFGCKACGQNRHELSRCFYVFPELRPNGFKPNKALVAKVSQALDDLNLAKEVETIRKDQQDGDE